jgi:hypothetical protein
MAEGVLSEEEIMKRVQRILVGVHSVPFIPQLFCATHPPNQVILLGFESFEFLFD